MALNVVVFATVAILLGGGDPAPGAPAERLVDAVADAQPADEPFPTLTETRLRVGRTRLDVVVADESGERSQGLRRRETIGDYDAMLFAYTEPIETTFTMSTVPVPLDIGFYAADGRLVSRLRMEPCAGTDFECPLYAPEGPFVYALETLADELPRGRLRAPG